MSTSWICNYCQFKNLVENDGVCDSCEMTRVRGGFESSGKKSRLTKPLPVMPYNAHTPPQIKLEMKQENKSSKFIEIESLSSSSSPPPIAHEEIEIFDDDDNEEEGNSDGSVEKDDDHDEDDVSISFVQNGSLCNKQDGLNQGEICVICFSNTTPAVKSMLSVSNSNKGDLNELNPTFMIRCNTCTLHVHPSCYYPEKSTSSLKQLEKSSASWRCKSCERQDGRSFDDLRTSSNVKSNALKRLSFAKPSTQIGMGSVNLEDFEKRRRQYFAKKSYKKKMKGKRELSSSVSKKRSHGEKSKSTNSGSEKKRKLSSSNTPSSYSKKSQIPLATFGADIKRSPFLNHPSSSRHFDGIVKKEER